MTTCRHTCLRVRAAAVVLCFAVSFFVFINTRTVSEARQISSAPVSRPRPSRNRRIDRPNRYSRFTHKVKAHNLSCNSCHKFPSANWQKMRPAGQAFPDITEYPKHESCLNCHMQQFFKGARPAICSVCHTNPSPRGGARHAFPNPREIFDTTPKGKAAISGFAISFPHDKHIEIVSRNERQDAFVNAAWTRLNSPVAAEESCAVCHHTYKPQDKSDDEYVTRPPANNGDAFWLKKGTFKTAPIGHATCFTCHSTDTGILPAPDNCAACHKLKTAEPVSDFDPKLAAAMKIDDKIMLTSWRRRQSSGTFRHEWFSHAELACSTCHNVNAMNTADPASTKVAFAACATCHVTATSDDGGALNFEIDSRKANPGFQCVKCHITFGKLPIPESHRTALAAAK